MQTTWEGKVVTPQLPVNTNHLIIHVEPVTSQRSHAGAPGRESPVHTLGAGLKQEGWNL